ncbi:MAG TPA: C40 family peptidase [Pseudonocardiaceae bacterium]|jgi:cell wall-associated NlpC family hydrolase|nr:C40 family peptidase [Pseudonocardiaceae bacterium]
MATADTPANPPPASNDPVAEYTRLSEQADALNEKMNAANVNLAKQQGIARAAAADVARAKSAEQAAQARENQYLDQVDSLTDASFEGARMSQLSALLTGTSAKDFLNRAEDLQDLAANNYAVLSKFASAVNAAKAAESRAQKDLQTAEDATAAAESLKQQLNQESTQLQHQAAQLLADKSKFTPQELAQLLSTGVKGVFVAPPGIRGRAMTIALAQRGKSYVWAGAGPNVFDCSGLVLWSYAQAGMPGIPHSAAAQQQLGVAVPKADMQPGDLVFFGYPASHVGIYVGNGLMVDAPHTGAVVRVEPLFSDFTNARRLGS